MAPTPTHTGYWIAGADGEVYAFGSAHSFGSYTASACDPVAAIFANPHAQGYRLVTVSGATIPFGNAPGGRQPTGTVFQCPPANQPPLKGGVLTLGGRIGPLQLGVSTEADVVADVGAPDATAIGNTGVSLPNYIALGYDCSVIPGAFPLVFQPLLQAPYCGTVYFLNVRTQTLAGFETTSSRYATAEGTRVGMTISEAQRRQSAPFYPNGCNEGVPVGDFGSIAQIFLFATGTNMSALVGSIGVDSSTNSVGVLAC